MNSVSSPTGPFTILTISVNSNFILPIAQTENSKVNLPSLLYHNQSFRKFCAFLLQSSSLTQPLLSTSTSVSGVWVNLTSSLDYDNCLLTQFPASALAPHPRVWAHPLWFLFCVNLMSPLCSVSNGSHHTQNQSLPNPSGLVHAGSLFLYSSLLLYWPWPSDSPCLIVFALTLCKSPNHHQTPFPPFLLHFPPCCSANLYI